MTSLSWRVDQMRMICEPSCDGSNAGLTTPFRLATASAVFGNRVFDMIGRPPLNQYSWVQFWVERFGAMPARLNAVELPPVTGSFGLLSTLVLWASKVSAKRSLTSQRAFRPSEPSLYFCSSRCCSKPKSLAPPAMSRM